MRKKHFLIFCATFFVVHITYGQGISKIQFRDSVEISLWDSNPPFAQQTGPEKYLPSRGDNVKRVTNVSNPTLTIYQFKDSINTQRQPAVVICPGGGYDYVVMNKEGTEVASRLIESGMRPIVLKYRVPQNRQEHTLMHSAQ